MSAPPLLQVDGLRIAVRGPGGFHPIVRELAFDVREGETLAIVGESGCGKSLSALAIMGLLQPNGTRVEAGRIVFEGRDLLQADEDTLCSLRGNRMAMVFQEPMTSLNPVLDIGRQVAEALVLHRGLGRREARREAVAALERVRIPDAERRAAMYPHQLSGGMRQRVMIAMALACRPRLLIADEPTTALDVSIQAQILALLAELQREQGTAIVLITHDLGVVCEMAERVMVLYGGRVAEQATVPQLFDAPVHPYTQGLMGAMPRRALRTGAARLQEIAGTVPSPAALPPGCAFAGRCPRALPHCAHEQPPMAWPAAGHGFACFNPGPTAVAAQEVAHAD
ncbi:ABC transporter ATP-binding protein [Variovorax sp. KK3]|uniref:ABC transporter ATP-binding protein n=1 Tax=Variovorax sp. KK3 TaxID=1855728 RepID=UPI00117C2D9D|nr:ABC transporter ATP-binding protein [Variovorax sp. KK3]